MLVRYEHVYPLLTTKRTTNLKHRRPDMKIKQGTTVYHMTLGKGYVLAIQYRKEDRLYMCYFPQKTGCEFITHKQLLTGEYEIRLKPVIPVKRKSGESLEDLLGGLLRSP